MSHFLFNLILVSWVFLGWYAIGIGPALYLLPKKREDAFLLAPLIGMCLLVLVGVFEITSLLVPLSPKANMVGLGIVSLSLCLCTIRTSSIIPLKASLPYFLVPLIALIIYAWLFHPQGFHLLVGGSDQMQYCQNARHITEIMHTGSPLDSPIARQDHFVYDLATQILPYLKYYRRGAEVVLGTTKVISGVSYEAAFPILIVTGLLTLGLAFAFLGRVAFKLTPLYCVLLQITIMSSFYMMVLHIQGSLALALGLAPGLIALYGLTESLKTGSLRTLFFTAIIVAGYLATYAEPVLITIAIPCFMLISWEMYQSRLGGLIALLRLGLLAMIIFVLTPSTFASIVYTGVANVTVALQSLTHHASHPGGNSLLAILNEWPFASVMLGGYSYYDTSGINHKIAKHFTPLVSLFLFSFIALAALIGLMKVRSRLASLFGFILIFWVCSGIFFSSQLENLHFGRSLQYAMPLIMLGLVLLAHHYRGKDSVKLSASALLLASFILFNGFTEYRTIRYLTRHDINTDHIVVRLDENNATWQALRHELQFSKDHETPVLISGYHETVRPTAITYIIRDQPHLIGESMDFWTIYLPHPLLQHTSSFNLRTSETEFNRRLAEESKPWPAVLTSLVNASRQAIVPNGHGLPIEWGQATDIFSPFTVSFPNIGDVVYRKRYNVHLASHMISALHRDNNGLFRYVTQSGAINVDRFQSPSKQLRLIYTGKLGDLCVKVGQICYQGKRDKAEDNIIIETPVPVSERETLYLAVSSPVKMRLLHVN